MSIGDPWHFPMTRGDPSLMAALQHRMRGDQSAIFKDPNLIGERMHFNDPLPGRVGNAVIKLSDSELQVSHLKLQVSHLT